MTHRDTQMLPEKNLAPARENGIVKEIKAPRELDVLG
jgi:hypothetical protein